MLSSAEATWSHLSSVQSRPMSDDSDEAIEAEIESKSHFAVAPTNPYHDISSDATVMDTELHQLQPASIPTHRPWYAAAFLGAPNTDSLPHSSCDAKQTAAHSRVHLRSNSPQSYTNERPISSATSSPADSSFGRVAVSVSRMPARTFGERARTDDPTGSRTSAAPRVPAQTPVQVDYNLPWFPAVGQLSWTHTPA
jgi:hypothetical protein